LHVERDGGRKSHVQILVLKWLGYTGAQILAFPIEMASHPYNSAARP